MSDYISKSVLIEILKKSEKENNHKSMIGYAEHIQEHRYLIHLVEKQPTLDEKEIIRKAFERVVERLEEEKSDWNDDYNVPIKRAIEIVKEVSGISE